MFARNWGKFFLLSFSIVVNLGFPIFFYRIEWKRWKRELWRRRTEFNGLFSWFTIRKGSSSCPFFAVHMIHVWENFYRRFFFAHMMRFVSKEIFPPKMWVKQVSSLFAHISPSFLYHGTFLHNSGTCEMSENSFKSSIRKACNLSSLNAI